jgi:membrane protease subunit HflC
MNRRLAVIGVIVILLGLLLSDTFYIVDEREQALVLQFGEVKDTRREPGLAVKVPFFQNVVYYEDRILDVDPPVEQVILADQRRLDVDSFARYRIVDPLLFFQTVNNETVAAQRLATFVNAALRRVLGNVTQLEVLSEQRATIMNDIRDEVASRAEPLGIDIVDVRIGRADVPEGTVTSVFDRMRSERQREAAEFRAQGVEQAQQIRSRADRETAVLIAEATSRAQILRGEGDAQATIISAEAYGQDPEFYRYYRRLEAYRNAMRAEDTTLILSPTSDFFRYFNGPPTGLGTAAAAPPAALPGPAAVPAPAETGGQEAPAAVEP